MGNGFELSGLVLLSCPPCILQLLLCVLVVPFEFFLWLPLASDAVGLDPRSVKALSRRCWVSTEQLSSFYVQPQPCVCALVWVNLYVVA